MTSLDPSTILSSSALVGLATLSVYAGSVGSYTPPAELECLPISNYGSSVSEQTPLRNGVSLRARHVLVGVAVVVLTIPMYLLLGSDPMAQFIRVMYCILSTNALCWTLSNLTRSVLGTTRYQNIPRIRLVLNETRLFLDFEYSFTRPDPPTTNILQGIRLTIVFYLFVSLATTISYIFGSSKSIYIADILMLSLAHVDMSLVKPSRLRTACLFLTLTPILFGWLAFSLGYGTLAVSENPNLNSPSQLLVPTTLSSLSTQPTQTIVLSALDIILPGKLVAFAYRLDAHLRHESKRGSITYFGATLVGYATALSIALGVTHFLGVAQLASFYLSPVCFLAFMGAALLRGEWNYVWGWKEGAQEEDLIGVQTEKNGNDIKRLR